MARVFITGSVEGLGLMAGQLLAEEGHSVTLHARNQRRATDARAALPEAETVIVGDLSSITQVRSMAKQANELGTFDAVIHNAGVGYRESRRIETEDGLSHVFAINVLAPYLLTALMNRPERFVYLGSGMHRGGDPDLSDLQWSGGAGTARRRTPTASSSTSCSPSPWPAIGPQYERTPSILDGCRRRWAGQARPMIWRSRRSPRPGSR